MTLTRLKFIHVVKVGELQGHQSESHLQEASVTNLSLEVSQLSEDRREGGEVTPCPGIAIQD